MSNCKLAHKINSETSKREVCWMWEKVSTDPDPEVFERRFVVVCDPYASYITSSLRYNSYGCDPVTGQPIETLDLDFVSLKYKKLDGTWYASESNIIYHVPETLEIRLEIGPDFISNYLTGDTVVLGVFWVDFVPGASLPPPELFDSNYELLPVPPANQIDPVTEYQGIMRPNDMKLWICIGETLPNTSGDTTMTIELYDEAAPEVLVTSFTKTGTPGNSLILDSSLYLLQPPGGQEEEEEIDEAVFSKWGGWITGDDIFEPYLEKQYPSDPQIIKLYYNVITQ